MIEVRDVSRLYRRGVDLVHALEHVTLDIPGGRFVALMGPSGSGKSTLMNLLAGLDRPDGGEVIVFGQALSGLDEDALATWRSRHVGLVFQFYNLLPVLSAVENVELPLVVSGVNARKARELAVQALDRVGLADRAYNRPSQLSGGQRQRVTSARALVNDPAIVWADEPTGALDSKTANEIMELMEQLNEEKGQTFVLVTHDEGVGRRCDRLVRMSDGLIISQETM